MDHTFWTYFPTFVSGSQEVRH